MTQRVANAVSERFLGRAQAEMLVIERVGVGLKERADSFFEPARRDRRVAEDLVAAMAGFRPQLLLDAAQVIPHYDRPVLLVWGDSCEFFPPGDAERLASDFPHATLRPVPGAKTWVPVDDPAALTDAIAGFVPRLTPVSRRA